MVATDRSYLAVQSSRDYVVRFCAFVEKCSLWLLQNVSRSLGFGYRNLMLRAVFISLLRASWFGLLFPLPLLAQSLDRSSYPQSRVVDSRKAPPKTQPQKEVLSPDLRLTTQQPKYSWLDGHEWEQELAGFEMRRFVQWDARRAGFLFEHVLHSADNQVWVAISSALPRHSAFAKSDVAHRQLDNTLIRQIDREGKVWTFVWLGLNAMRVDQWMDRLAGKPEVSGSRGPASVSSGVSELGRSSLGSAATFGERAPPSTNQLAGNIAASGMSRCLGDILSGGGNQLRQTWERLGSFIAKPGQILQIGNAVAEQLRVMRELMMTLGEQIRSAGAWLAGLDSDTRRKLLCQTLGEAAVGLVMVPAAGIAGAMKLAEVMGRTLLKWRGLFDFLNGLQSAGSRIPDKSHLVGAMLSCPAGRAP